jgi:hypothetical protein
MVAIADWVGQRTTTIGQGSIVLGSSMDGFATFAAIPDGQVYYTIADGLSRESGIGTLSAGMLARTTVTATLVGGAYDNTSPEKLNLSGSAKVFCTFNSKAFADILQLISDAGGGGGGGTWGSITGTLSDQVDLQAALDAKLGTSTTTTSIAEGTNLYHTVARVLASALTGLSTVTGTAITAADTVLSAFGKLQKQITDNVASISGKADTSTLTAHTGNTSNPHSVTKAQVGLGNCDNTSDANKPVSTATSTALALKADASSLTSHTGNTSNPHSVTKSQVGLGNCDNTSDANKPVSTAQATAIALKIDTTAVPAAVRATDLTGLSLSTGTAITSADTVLSAAGKLQKQVTTTYVTVGTTAPPSPFTGQLWLDIN